MDKEELKERTKEFAIRVIQLNQNSEIRIPQSKICNSHSEIRIPQSEIRNPVGGCD